MEPKNLIRIWGTGNKKSGREAAALEEIPHSYLKSIVAQEVSTVKMNFARPQSEDWGEPLRVALRLWDYPT